MPLRRLLSEMGADEFTYWIAFNRVFGFPDPWAQAGTVAAAATRPYQKKGARPASALDFIPADRKVGRRRQSMAEMMAAFRGFAGTLEAARGQNGR